MSLIDEFEREVDLTFKGETYKVRDNGSVFRLAKPGKKTRKLDEEWSFGRQDMGNGYMFIGTHRVHQIVCTAFHGVAPDPNLVVDHIDTNRANNRPENLRFVTRLENALLNPITARRIEFAYGSIEAFLADPSNPQNSSEMTDVSWMRTVSAEEAARTRHRFETWAKSGQLPKGGALGEWLFAEPGAPAAATPPTEVKSLTPLARQLKWNTPTAFPTCPSSISDGNLAAYSQALTFGTVFSTNQYGDSTTIDAELAAGGEKLSVITRIPSTIKGWAVALVWIEGSKFVHCSEGTFFGLGGAYKRHCELLGVDPLDTIDDYC